MAVVISQGQVDVVPSSLITYIFRSPEDDDDYHSSNVPIIISADDPNGKAHTFNEYRHLVLRFASGIRTLGLKYGSGNCLYFPVVALGTIAAGGIFTSALQEFQARNVAFHLQDTNARYFLASRDHLDTALAAAAQIGFPKSKIFIVDDSLEQVGQQPELLYLTRNIILRFNGNPCKANLKQDLPLRTSGIRKGAEISHYALVGQLAQSLRHIDPAAAIHETILCDFQMGQTVGQMMNMFIPLKARCKLIILKSYDFASFRNAMEKYRPTFVTVTKPILDALTCEGRQVADLSSVKSLSSGATFVPQKTLDLCQRLYGKRCDVGYGMTECGFVIAPNPFRSQVAGSVGELRPSVQGKVVDEGGRVLPKNEVGEILIRTPFAMTRYINDATATRNAFTSDGWTKTGDIGYVNGKDQWFVVDRKKDLLKVNGVHIAPADIENVLIEQAGVLHAAVVSLPRDEEGNDRPRAYIVKRADADIDTDEIHESVERELGWQNRLTGGIVFVDNLPVNSAGKVLRTKLKELARQSDVQDTA